MKAIYLAAAGIFAAAVSLPLLHMATGLPPDMPLAGAEGAVAAPRMGLRAWWDGELQKSFDEWINRKMGLRGILVRTANQINYSVFGEMPRRGGTQVVKGKNGYLFEKVYVDAFREGGRRPEEELRSVSASTRKLQELLAADGVAFLLVVSPSKAEIYPEHLPDEADAAGRGGRRSNYENLIGHLRADGVNLVDAHELFREWKAEPGAPMLFAKGGTHWNQYGAARTAGAILERLRELTRLDLPTIEVTGATTNRTIVGADNDLGELANLWSGRQLAGPQTHPVFEKREGSHRPDLLFVGDSFVFTLTDFMDREDLYGRRETYYYYNRRFSHPEKADEPLDKRSLDLLAEVRGRDAVVVEVNEYWLPRIGFGFVRDLLKAYALREGETGGGVRSEPAAVGEGE